MKDLWKVKGISHETFHRGGRRYGGFEVSDAKRLKELEDENRPPNKLVADLSPDKEALRDVLSRDW